MYTNFMSDVDKISLYIEEKYKILARYSLSWHVLLNPSVEANKIRVCCIFSALVAPPPDPHCLNQYFLHRCNQQFLRLNEGGFVCLGCTSGVPCEFAQDSEHGCLHGIVLSSSASGCSSPCIILHAYIYICI